MLSSFGVKCKFMESENCNAFAYFIPFLRHLDILFSYVGFSLPKS